MVITQRFLSRLKEVSTQFKWILNQKQIRTCISHEEFRNAGGEIRYYTQGTTLCCPMMAIQVAENKILTHWLDAAVDLFGLANWQELRRIVLASDGSEGYDFGLRREILGIAGL